MQCLCLKGLHPALQEHESALNMDAQGPYLVYPGSQLHAHMVSGRKYIPTYAFSLGEPHSSVQPLQRRYPLSSSTHRHHCPPRSKWSGAARSSVCCTGCQTACRAQRRLSGAGGQPGTEKGNCTCICPPLMALQVVMCFTFYFQHEKRKEGTENIELSLNCRFGPH